MLSFRSSVVAAASALVAIGLIAAPVNASASTQSSTSITSSASGTATATPGDSDAATVSISPANDGVVKPGQSLTTSVTVTNDTSSDFAATTASLHIIRSVEADRDDLTDWLHNTSVDGYLGVPISYFDVPAVPAGQSVTVKDVTVDAATVGLRSYTSFGARRIAVDFSAGSVRAVGRSAITWYPSLTYAPTGISVAVPITATISASDVDNRDGMLSVSELAAQTAVDGTLTQQLDAAAGHNVAIGVDPRIIASIRILGANAPSSAIAWLRRLESVHNETFALAWADADVTGLRQAGTSGIVAPISLDQEVDKDNFPGASTSTPTPSGSASASASASASGSATATPTPTPSSGGGAGGDHQDAAGPTLPTTKTLLDFPYTLTNVTWPYEDSVSDDDLTALASAKDTTILSSGNTSAGSETTVGAAATVNGTSALVSDETMSRLVRTAATAKDEQSWASAITKLTATLATVTRERTSGTPILLTLGRDLPSDSSRLSQTLDAIEGTAWVSPTDLSTAATSTPTTLSLTSAVETSDRLTQLQALVAADNQTNSFSTAMQTPTDVTAPERLRLMALASNGWRSVSEVTWLTQVRKQTHRADKLANSVGIVDSSNINLYADRSSLPISVRNKSAYPVTVTMTITPSSSALRVEKNDLLVKVAPDSQTRITFPVQSLANGKVALTMSLASATGVRIAVPSTVDINVQAQWETIITAGGAIAVVLIFGIGILRSVRRRLRRRRAGLPEDEPDPNRLLDDPDGENQGPPTDAEATVGMAAMFAGTATAGAATPQASDASGGGWPATAEAQQQAVIDAEIVDAETLAAPSSGSGGLGRASALLAAGTMISRVLGFVKTFVLAAAIGNTSSRAADAFAISNQLPNNIYALIAGGLLSAVLIPQIVRSMSQHRDGGAAYVNKIVTLGSVAFIVVAAAATIAAPILVNVYAAQGAGGGKGFSEDQIALAVAFAYWCLPQILFYALYSLLGEVLNARQQFGPFTWAPLLNNVVAIAGLIVFMAMFGGRDANMGVDSWTPLKIAVLAGSATLGVAVQAGFLALYWRRAGLRFRPDFRWRGVGLRSTGTAAGWLFAMILVTQAAGIVQSRVASLADGAGNATLQYSWLLFMLPHSIITVSVATAYFTRMSQDADRGDIPSVRRNLSLSLRIVGLFTVFATVALIVTAFPFARIYERSFGDVSAMAFVLFAYMPGLVLFSVLFIVQRVFWALNDHRTPFFMQLVQSGLFVVGTLFVALLPGSAIGVGVAAMTTIAGAAQTVVALVLVRRRLNGIEGSVVARSHVQFVVAALIAGVGGALVANFFGAFSADGFAMTDISSALITLVLTGCVMTIVYMLVLIVGKNPEVRSARDLLRRRLGR